jgi:hypothetical protein
MHVCAPVCGCGVCVFVGVPVPPSGCKQHGLCAVPRMCVCACVRACGHVIVGVWRAALPGARVCAAVQDDFVSFLLGCSFSFEEALLAAGVPVRHIEENKNVPMYVTNVDTEAVGPFRGAWLRARPPPPLSLLAGPCMTPRWPSLSLAPPPHTPLHPHAHS